MLRDRASPFRIASAGRGPAADRPSGMVRSLGIIVRLTLRVSAGVPFGLGFIGAQRTFPTSDPSFADLFAAPGVLRIPSLPPRLFFGKVFVLPCLGVTHSLIA